MLIALSLILATLLPSASADVRRAGGFARRQASLNSTTTSSQPIPTPTPYNSDPRCSYWLEEIKHQGIAPYQNDSSYQIFRNVRDYGAYGDGIHDDTAAINLAISSPGNRCAPGLCNSSTTSPAVVYFPAGTYKVSGDIIDYYYTSLIGNPNCLPTIKVASNYSGAFIIDGDLYGANGLSYGATNVFWRQIRNFIIDTTSVPANTSAIGIHWPTGQATSVTNVVFNLNAQPGTQHVGLFIESGSGGFLSDLIFYGGLYGCNVGNQQFTSRNFTFYNTVTAINQLWDWGWTYQQMNFNNVTVGLNMSTGGNNAQSVGSIVLFDSVFNNVGTGIVTAHNPNSLPPASGVLVMENVDFDNVGIAVLGPNGTDLAGGTFNIPAWAQGHAYYPDSANYTELNGYINPNLRSPALTSLGKFYTETKPQYQNYPVGDFISVRDMGATGNGNTDDTAALQAAIYAAKSQNKILFIDGGDYVVTSTLYIPAGVRIVGEPYPVIIGTGPFFGDINNPVPVLQFGKPGEVGTSEFTDTILSTRGHAPGAILLQWNLASANAPQYSPGQGPPGWQDWHNPTDSGVGAEYLGPSGIWDVHTRIGGFTGSDLQITDCPATIAGGTQNTTILSASDVKASCIAAAGSFHITSSARNLYLENTWLWVADHDADDGQLRQITVYAGRGLNIEANYGIWLVGTAVEHHALYEYQFAHTQDIFAGHIQTETAYYQPNPPAQIPFPNIPALNDPIFPAHCLNGSYYISQDVILQPNTLHNDCDGWGLRILDTFDAYIYGAGHYSFFYNYNVTCSNMGQGSQCQSHIVSIEDSYNNVGIYGLNTVGTQNLITFNGQDLVPAADNSQGFPQGIALFRAEHY